MNKTTALSIAGLTLIAALLIGCGTLGLAVRSGVVREQLISVSARLALPADRAGWQRCLAVG